MNFRVKKSEETFKSIVDENGDEVATVWSTYTDAESTAILFAAAPELLEALELIACCDQTGYLVGYGYFEDIAQKAIAKAKGE